MGARENKLCSGISRLCGARTNVIPVRSESKSAIECEVPELVFKSYHMGKHSTTYVGTERDFVRGKKLQVSYTSKVPNTFHEHL